MAGELQLSVDVEEALFADIPAERRLALPAEVPSPAELRTQVNLALAQGLLRRAQRIEIDISAGARDVVRAIHLRRLICVAEARPEGGTRLSVSGVCSLFRRTTLYGRAMASLLPRLAWCGDYALRAWGDFDGAERLLRLDATCDIKPSRPPRPYDSKLEERFARDFAKVAPDWELSREPAAIAVAGTLVFPDFGLRHEGRTWLVEIVGFWTPEYVQRKFDAYRGSGVLLCVDERLGCGRPSESDLAVVWFRRRIDPEQVLEALTSIDPVGFDVRTTELRLRDYFIDFAGRHPQRGEVHRRLEQLRVGDELDLRVHDQRCVLCQGGVAVAALSASASRHWRPRLGDVESVTVAAFVHRRAAESGARYRGQLQVHEWRVPLVQIRWRPQPDHPASTGGP